MQGENDQYATNAQLNAIDRLTTGDVYIHLIKDSAHSPHLDAKHEVIPLMLNFITMLVKQASSSSGKVEHPQTQYKSTLNNI